MPRLETFWHTITALGGNGTVNSGTAYLGTMGGTRIVGSVFADQAGANPSLVIHWSSDVGQNNDIPDTNIGTPLAASTKTFINVEVRLPYCQVVYTNGAVAQTTFRLYLYIVDTTSNLTVT